MKLSRNAVLWSAALVLALGSPLMLSSCGSDTPNNPNPGGGTPADLTITVSANAGSNSYTPNPATVQKGQTVAWRNSSSDGQPHTATTKAGVTPTFNTGSISLNATSSPIAMGTAGSFAYQCGFHPSMEGVLNVADVVVTITGDNGANSFSPDPVVVKVGETVAWRNANTENHTATTNIGVAPPFNTGNIVPGATSTPITMTTAGTFAYHCTPHSATMLGTVTVNP